MPAFKPGKQAHAAANKNQLSLLDFTGSKQTATGRKRSNEHQTSSITDPLPSSRLDTGTEPEKEQHDTYTIDLDRSMFDDSFSDLENESWVFESTLTPKEGNDGLDEDTTSTSQGQGRLLGSKLGTQESVTHWSSSPVRQPRVLRERQSPRTERAEVLPASSRDQVGNSTKAGQKRVLNVVQGGLISLDVIMCYRSLTLRLRTLEEAKLKDEKSKRLRVSAYDSEASSNGTEEMERPAQSIIDPMASVERQQPPAPAAKTIDEIDSDVLAEFGDLVEFH